MFANDHEKYVRIFFENPDVAVYGTEVVIAEIVRVMQGMKMIPSVVSAKIVFDKMNLRDRATEVAKAQAGLNQVLRDVDAPPLTRNEIEYFASLSRSDLANLYWGVDGDAINEFAVRYRRASREHGYVIPPRPSRP